MQWMKRFWVEEEGAEVAEWVLFVAVLGIAVIAAASALDPAIRGAYTTLAESLETHADTLGNATVGGGD